MLYALNAATGAVAWSTNVGAAIPRPDEHNAVQLTGLGAGQGLLVVPAANTLTAFGAPTPPSVPGGLQAAAGNAQVSLSWSASTGTAPITYSVYRGTATGGESATPVASGLTGTSYVDTGLANGTTYYYEVRATNAGGSSGLSAEASATPVAPVTAPGAPSLSAASARGKGVTLTWTRPANGGSPITSYTLYRGTSPGTELAYGSVVCSSATCTYTDTNTKKGTLYVYQVAAVNAAGTGPRSNEASATG
jgi:fibronectin type 3 domain-containing protein